MTPQSDGTDNDNTADSASNTKKSSKSSSSTKDDAKKTEKKTKTDKTTTDSVSGTMFQNIMRFCFQYKLINLTDFTYFFLFSIFKN